MTRTVVHYIDTFDFGGAERSLLHLLAALDRERWRPVLFHPEEPGLRPLVRGASEAGVALRPVPRMHGPASVLRIPAFYRMLRAERPALLHAHLNWPLACTAGILGAAAARIPVVATVQLFGALPRAVTMPLQRRVVPHLVRRYIAVSRDVAHDVARSIGVDPARIRVVHNGIPRADPGVAEPDAAVRRQMSGGVHRPVVLALARLDAQKGLDGLLRAAVMLPDTAIAIAGEGPERQALEREAQRLGVADRTAFLGFRTDVGALLASADIFVLPSVNEGLPLSLLEALAAERPVVASSIGGVTEVVRDDETALLVPPGDADALAHAIRRLLEDPALAARLARAGRALVRRDFSAEGMAEGVMRTYEEALARDVTAPSPAHGEAGSVDLGDLRRTTPVSRVFGFDRGSPVDRRYIESFLAGHASDIRGRVLEVKDAAYTKRFGGSGVQASDVLDIDPTNPRATLVADLSAGEQLPSNAFDCILLTQTLHLVFDVGAAIRTLHRILKPGGVLLATVPGITQIPRAEAASWYWSFSEVAADRLFRAAFPPENVQVRSYGNVLTATAFLYGLAAHELRPAELDAVDPDYPVTIAVRAVKGTAAS